jgi:uncharacterized membrane protein
MLLWLALAVALPLAIGLRWEWFRHWTPLGLWPVFDLHDLRVYFESSRWAVSSGTLYRDVTSEYPLAANLVFGAVRALAAALHPLPDSFHSFALVWIAFGWVSYLAVLRVLSAHARRPAPLLWLTPTALHFSLLRFDGLTALVTLLAMLALREGRNTRAALWLGLALALKGFALFLLPALAVYLVHRHGLREAVRVTAIALAPFIAGNLAVLAYAGRAGMMSPYAFQAGRSFNGESTWDAIGFVLSRDPRQLFGGVPWLPAAVQVAGALAAAALRPRTFEELANAFLVAAVVFVSGSVFYSPQFALWLVPFACFAPGLAVPLTCAALSWVTFAYFPIAYAHRHAHPAVLSGAIVVVTILRLALLPLAARAASRRRPEPAA